MIFSGLKFFHKGQAGFTLIEILVAIAITGIIAVGASVSSAQLLNQTARDRDYTLASRQANNAIHWISRDAIMAQSIDGCAGFPETEILEFTWMGWDNNTYTAAYSLADGELRRTFTGGPDTSMTLIAQYIHSDAEKTFCSYVDGVFSITITSTVGEGNRVFEITKNRLVTNRPDL